MIPTPLFYQLLGVALVLLCLLSHVGVPDRPLPKPQPPLASNTRRRRRSHEPQPFPGLMHKPRGEAGEQGADGRPQAPGEPPPILTCTRGRRRTVDTHAHCCPAPQCSYPGWRGRGHLRAHGHPGGQPGRQLQSVAGEGYFSETPGTGLHGKPASPERIVRVLAGLAEGLGIRGTARGCELDPHTVLRWLVEAAEPLQALSAYCLPEVPIHQVPLDARYAVRSAVSDGPMREAEAIERLSRAPPWGWTASDPEPKGLLRVQGGERPLALAHALLPQIAPLLAPGGGPLGLSDGDPHALPALVTHCGPWGQPPRRQAPGPVPKARWMPRPALRYAPVVKTVRQRRLVEVKPRVVWGTKAAGAQVLATCGWQSNPAVVERLKLSRRQRGAVMRRRSATSWKGEAGLGPPLALFQVYHPFVLPHARFRQALAEPLATHGTGSATGGRPCTPAMAAGWPERGWSRQEVLRCRVPPWPPPQTV